MDDGTILVLTLTDGRVNWDVQPFSKLVGPFSSQVISFQRYLPSHKKACHNHHDHISYWNLGL